MMMLAKANEEILGDFEKEDGGRRRKKMPRLEDYCEISVITVAQPRHRHYTYRRPMFTAVASEPHIANFRMVDEEGFAREVMYLVGLLTINVS